MAKEEKEATNIYKNVFKCINCELYAKYDYYGNKPTEHYLKKSKAGSDTIILLENSYICDDPFSDLKMNYLILGSNCNECKNMICLSGQCSIFYYNKRFCIKCALNNLDEFPLEIKNELKKCC
jgi:hypothetical protein